MAAAEDFKAWRNPRRERVAMTGPPSIADGENMMVDEVLG
jgi:hypothetical protein